MRKGKAASEKLEAAEGAFTDETPSSGSLALRLCHVALNHTDGWRHEIPAHEGQVAAAALIASSLGKSISECETGRPLSFNTPRVEIECLQLHAPAPCGVTAEIRQFPA